MELSDRKKKILRAIVDLYIRTAEPVASKTIAQMPDMDFSSATIRNEMAELTALGYLEQPHTSAGRIPSPAGYRLYVDELMQDYRLSTDETKSINQAMELKMQEVDKVVSQVGKLVSQMTNLPAYAMAARAAGLTVKRFDLILADSGSFILVVMLSDSSVKNKLIRLPVELTEADLKLLGAVLNASVTELTAEQLSPELLSRVTRSAGNAASISASRQMSNFFIQISPSSNFPYYNRNAGKRQRDMQNSAPHHGGTPLFPCSLTASVPRPGQGHWYRSKAQAKGRCCR